LKPKTVLLRRAGRSERGTGIDLDEAFTIDVLDASSRCNTRGRVSVSLDIPGTDHRGNYVKTDNVSQIPELSLMEGGPGDALMLQIRLPKSDNPEPGPEIHLCLLKI
jgi:hypothetical protein